LQFRKCKILCIIFNQGNKKGYSILLRIKGAREIYWQGDKRSAVEVYEKCRGKGNDTIPKAVKCLEEDSEGLLSFDEEPKECWMRLRMTNAIAWHSHNPKKTD
jgi:transposase-like protein